MFAYHVTDALKQQLTNWIKKEGGNEYMKWDSLLCVALEMFVKFVGKQRPMHIVWLQNADREIMRMVFYSELQIDVWIWFLSII